MARSNLLPFLQDGQRIASGSWDRTVRIWDLASQKNDAVVLQGFDGFPTVAFSPDGKTLATNDMYGTAKLYDLPVIAEVERLAGQFVMFSDKNARLLTANQNRVSQWDLTNGFAQIPKMLPTVLGKHWSISSDFSRLANVNANGMVEVWDLDANRCRLLPTNSDRRVDHILILSGREYPGSCPWSSGTTLEPSFLDRFGTEYRCVLRICTKLTPWLFHQTASNSLPVESWNPVNEYRLVVSDLHGNAIATLR